MWREKSGDFCITLTTELDAIDVGLRMYYVAVNKPTKLSASVYTTYMCYTEHGYGAPLQ